MKSAWNGSAGRLLWAVAAVCFLAVVRLGPVRLWNGVIEAPAWMLFSVAYVLEWDTNDR
jgi:hypothetical protein